MFAVNTVVLCARHFVVRLEDEGKFERMGH
jgi:hypothetical protein